MRLWSEVMGTNILMPPTPRTADVWILAAFPFFRLHVPSDSVVFMSMSIEFLMPTPRTADVLFFTAFEFCTSSTTGLTDVTSVVLVSFADNDNNAAQKSAAKMFIFIFTMVATERRATCRLS